MNLTWLLNRDHPTTLRAWAKVAKNRLINPAVRDIPIQKQFSRWTKVIEEVVVVGGVCQFTSTQTAEQVW